MLVFWKPVSHSFYSLICYLVIGLLCLYDILFVQVLKNVLSLTFDLKNLKNTEIKMI